MGKQKNNGGAKESSTAAAAAAGKDTITVVLKVGMHCYDCADKVVKSLKGFEGVGAVKADVESSKLIVTAAKDVDPWKLRERVQAKTRKNVELVSPAVKKPDGAAKKPDYSKKAKEKEVKSTTTAVMLKIPIHCKGCADKIHTTISKIKGVESVATDADKNLVTVKGTMDAKALPGVLTKKLKLAVEVVQPKKDAAAAAAAVREKKKDGEGGEEEQIKKYYAAVAAAAAAAAQINRMNYYDDGWYGYYHGAAMIPQPQPYPLGPQLFSDENPNACSVM